MENSANKRIVALDLLRGLAILGMVLSGLIPDTLPRWMYHAQVPPPDRVFDPNLPGITWVDLVFPFFLFAMGVAIPIAMQGLVRGSAKTSDVVKRVGSRALNLAAFAILSQHFRLGELGKASWGTALWALLGFGLMLGAFSRIGGPAWIKRSCALGCLVMLMVYRYPNGNVGFEQGRIDIILMVLANVAFSGALIWWLTREKPWHRGVAMALVYALFLTRGSGGIGAFAWNFDPVTYLKPALDSWYRLVPDIYNMEFHKYLLIVLPGTVVGDMLMGRPPMRWTTGTAQLAFLLGIIASAVACAGLLTREIWWTALGLAICVGGMWSLTAVEPESRESGIIRLSALLVLIGMIAEPLGGGIKKDPSDLSYWLLTAGLAGLMLVALIAAVARLGLERRSRVIADCGANPMMAYALVANFIPSFNFITQYGAYAGTWFKSPWLLALMDGGIKTALVAWLAAWATRKGWLLRA